MSDQELQNVVLVDGDDPAMQQAYRLARNTFRFFWRELTWERRRIVPGLDMTAIKVKFSDPPEKQKPDTPSVEFMWVGDVDFDGRKISGTLMNEPSWLTSVKVDDRVQFGPKRLCDWMYSVHDKVYGGHTINFMRSKMGKAERKQHDSAWGLNFGDPDVIEYVPPEYLGTKSKGIIGRLFAGKPKPQDPREISQIEHPMAENMLESLKEFMEKNPNQLTETNENGFTYLHHMALAGAAGSVKLLLSLGADAHAKTSHGLTAKDLATTLGWSTVVDVLDTHNA